MKYRIQHVTHYRYNDSVSICQNEAHLRPRHCGHQHCLTSRLDVSPRPAVLDHHSDLYGNQVDYFAIQSPHKELTVSAYSEVDITYPGFSPLLQNSPSWESVRDAMQRHDDINILRAREYRLDSPLIPTNDDIHEYALPSFQPQQPVLVAVRDLMKRIFTEFQYDTQFTTIVTPLHDVLQHKRGVCQDFAHLMIACLRSVGLAARYVSGYLETLPPPGQTKLRGSDASHAWLSVYVPEQGWIDFDPTNDQIPTFQHITTAWGRDYSDVTPLKGIIFGGGAHTLTVAVDVDRIEEKVIEQSAAKAA